LLRYEYLINRRVLEILDAAEEGERGRLLAAFDRLENQPEQAYDFLERGTSGADIRCKFFGDWLLRYRVDSPVRQVIVVDCHLT